ncbi:phage tail protein [Streptomyces sp. NPDC005262]|uniref:phage tail protein n=1 Tax=Streptomyces sp. NPDC005262 TaxID=3364710 RepID=UPI003693FC51
MSEPYLGEIRLVGFNYAPDGWALCNGQLLPISQNTSLFTLLGTLYGGDGLTTFALPDLRGRLPMHQGQGLGLSPRTIGESGGAETVALTTDQIPSHTHTLTGSAARQDTDLVSGATPTKGGYYTTQTPTVGMHPAAIAATGGGRPHTNLQPFLCVNFIIALVGLYPSQA